MTKFRTYVVRGRARSERHHAEEEEEEEVHEDKIVNCDADWEPREKQRAPDQPLARSGQEEKWTDKMETHNVAPAKAKPFRGRLSCRGQWPLVVAQDDGEPRVEIVAVVDPPL